MGLNVILARHAESVWHQDNRYAGRSDVELSEEGHRQASALAQWAAEAGLDAVWCSPLRRAHDTAQPAANAAGVAVRVDPRLVELDFGIAEGLTVAELDDKAPEDLAAFRRDPVTAHFPGGEHPREAVTRYADALADVRTRHRSGRVLLVGHNTMIRLALCSWLGLELRGYRAVFPRLANCALTELDVDDDRVSLLRYNCSAGTAA